MSERQTAQPAPEVTIFIPCLNEEKHIAGAIETAIASCRSVGCPFEILVFDDGSTDGSSAAVMASQILHPEVVITLIRNERNRGVAWSFVEGAFRGRGTYYRLVCGDNVEPQATQEAILKARGSADIIVPYFTEIRNRPLYRTIISALFTRLVNLASRARLHYYNGCPLYRREDVLRYHVETTGFGYQAEFLTRLIYEGKTYKELPLIAYDREGSAALTVKNFLSVGHSLLTIALRRLRIVLFE